MLKTIKKKKEVRIDELFKYITMNADVLLANKEFYVFRSKTGHEVIVDRAGNVNFSFMNYTPEDLFTIEVEEEITEKTEFLGVQEVYLDIEEQKIHVENYNGKYSIGDVLNNHDFNTKCLQIYAFIGVKKELIWERDEE